jgi:glucokinase
MAPVVVGLDVGGTKVLGRVVDLGAPTVAVVEQRMATPVGPEALVGGIVGLVADLTERATALGSRSPVAVGVGIPGLVGRDGVVRLAPHLPGVTDLDVGGALSAALDLPVAVDNDANCAGLAEVRIGVATGLDDVAVVTLGTGIGAGFVVAGRLLRGARGFAGEAGHLQVERDGLPCPCGKRGCWERYASGSGLALLAREVARDGGAPGLCGLPGAPEAISGEAVVALARTGDPDALAVLDRFAWWVGVGLAGLIDLLDPEVVVIGGGVIEAGDLVLDPVRRHVAPLVLGRGHRPLPGIRAASLGSAAGAIGAALLAGESAL